MVQPKNNSPIANEIYDLFLEFLGREPAESEIQYYLQLIEKGEIHLVDVSNMFLNSQEFQKLNEFSTQQKLPLPSFNLDNNILYFLHIPKTAGTTLISLVDDHFNLDTILHEQVWNEILPKMPETFSQFRLIRGHFGYGIHKILPKKPLILTILREPVDRVLSFYEHIRRDPISNNWVDEDFIDLKEEISDILENPNRKKLFINNQTRYMALDLDVLNITKSCDQKDLKKFYLERCHDFLSPNYSDESLIKTAKKRISEFPFIGITEKFDESLMLLCYTFGWRPIKKIWKLMISPSRLQKEDLPQKVINKISEYTKLDRELYEFSLELFNQRFAQMVIHLKENYYNKKLAKLDFHELIFEMLEKNYEDHYNNTIKTQTSSIDFDFTQKMSGSGWYQREIHADKKNAHRWTGPDMISSIDFPLKTDKDLKIQVRIFASVIPSVLKSLKLFANDNPVSITIEPAGKKFLVQGKIPKSSLQSKHKFTRISFKVNRTLSLHSVYPNNPDERPVGIAIDFIKIKPN